ncbi:MAG TPA: heme-binding protein [Gammaproteobacteria bacterium]
MGTWTKLAGGLLGCGLALNAAVNTARAEEDSALVTFQMLSPEVAQALAEATLDACRKAGFQVAVSVVDRAGVPQVMLRDRYAGAHTPDTATRKAWTAASFRTDTLALAEVTQPGKPQSGVRGVTHALMIGGGVPIEVAGSLVGAVGVSGAPDGKNDDDCVRAGLAVIEDRLAF